MARLHEHQGKAILARAGLSVPRGFVVGSADEAASAVTRLSGPCVIKIQAWTTGRAALGGIAFAETPAQAAEHARRMLQIRVGQFPVSGLLVEEKLAISREVFVSLTIDDRQRQPVMLIGAVGGTGIEGRGSTVRRVPCPIHTGPADDAIRAALGPDSNPSLVEAIQAIFQAAKSVEARSLEVNPLVVTADGRVVAADCRITVDDYAVFRHPELGIEIARELDHPPTALERTAYAVDQADPRGTFYFVQMASEAAAGSKGLVGFHGAGGGGSMMAMDAVQHEGFTVANFTDTSGNPSAGKVYRAARIILSQPGIVGYFGSGSGVASQEQYWSAYGLAKAFWELEIDIPVVIRLGGNAEDRAVEILQSVGRDVHAIVEGYRKSDPPAKIAARFAMLVVETKSKAWSPRKPRRPAFVRQSDAICLPIRGGRVWIDGRANPAPIAARSLGLMTVTDGRMSHVGDIATKDSELIACEVECRRDNIPGFFVELDIPGWDE
ncbi:MAG: acetate--CoA ligase family protein [Gemmataceae bacterium]|nr:acetate--CoA ligase family protein [Gemmataceae bacterium]